MSSVDMRESRSPPGMPESRKRIDAGAAYRASFLARAESSNALLLADGNDGLRRVSSWAPFVVLPGAMIGARMAPSAMRVPLWIGSLIAFAGLSTVMWNTSNLED